MQHRMHVVCLLHIVRPGPLVEHMRFSIQPLVAKHTAQHAAMTTNAITTNLSTARVENRPLQAVASSSSGLLSSNR